MQADDFPARPAVGTGSAVAAGTVLIELGAERGAPDGYADPGHRTVPTWLAPLFTVLLVLLSSGASAAPPAPLLTQLLSVALGPADSYALTDDAMLLVHSPTAATLTAYELASGRRRWSAPAALPAYRVRSGAGLVLLRTSSAARTDSGTLALSARTGQARWRTGGSILPIAGSPTVLSVSEVRNSASGGRRVQGPVSGVDPQNGQVRWSLPIESTAMLLSVPAAAVVPDSGAAAVPNAGAAAEPGGSPASGGSGASAATPRLLVVYHGGLAELHDLTTGRKLGTGRLPSADYGIDNPGVVGGLLVLRHLGPNGVQLSAYDPATLQRRWSRPAASAYYLLPCGALACLVSRSGVHAVDPATGADRWYQSGWRGVEQRGGVLLAYGSLAADANLVGVVDPGTGRLRVALHGWQPVPGAGGGDHILVTSSEPPGARTMVGVVDPGTARLRPLGRLPVGAGDCRAVPGRLLCRTGDGDLVVWSYPWR